MYVLWKKLDIYINIYLKGDNVESKFRFTGIMIDHRWIVLPCWKVAGGGNRVDED